MCCGRLCCSLTDGKSHPVRSFSDHPVMSECHHTAVALATAVAAGLLYSLNLCIMTQWVGHDVIEGARWIRSSIHIPHYMNWFLVYNETSLPSGAYDDLSHSTAMLHSLCKIMVHIPACSINSPTEQEPAQCELQSVGSTNHTPTPQDQKVQVTPV